MSGVTEENHENQLGWLVSRPKFENRSANHIIFALGDKVKVKQPASCQVPLHFHNFTFILF
jgi:hypothetical protein